MLLGETAKTTSKTAKTTMAVTSGPVCLLCMSVNWSVGRSVGRPSPSLHPFPSLQDATSDQTWRPEELSTLAEVQKIRVPSVRE